MPTTDTPTRRFIDATNAFAEQVASFAAFDASTVETVQRLAGLLDIAMNYAARDMREQAQSAANTALEAIAEALEARTTPAQMALELDVQP